ncbi:MAG: exosortase system-associated protein, TIGR04073 family [Methyloglobulus sp.]|uniref:exosortase system-associated protein, TIGR04073 family n=1 Tax=Methyloglobulus sp. TaxID=2518622 RepID=UPI0017A4ED6F|nr:exosortase system-associated protein, TIGR04073 family [Methyloglobulus sp.]
MTPFRQITIVTLFLTLLLAQIPAFAAADYYQQQLQNERLLERQQRQQIKQRENARYRSQVGDKALNGVANIFTGPLELPKNIINQVNYNYSNSYSNSFGENPDDNIVYGVIGGVISGALNATGRIMTGVTDLVTAPLPTKPIIQPRYVWDDFDKKNTYGQVFRLVDNPKIEPYVAPAPRPVAAISPVQDQTEQYSQQTNQNLDTMFRKEMQK